jgi:hypothetical protein
MLGVLHLHACMHDALGTAGPSPGERHGEKVNGALQNLQARDPAFNPIPVRFQSRMALHSVQVSCCVALYSHISFPFSFPVAGFACLVHIIDPWGLVLVVTCIRRHGSPTVPAPVRHACEIQAIHVWICFL